MGTKVARKSVELFYDVVSPYSWIAFEVLCRYKEVWNIDLKLKPLFIGGIMRGSGNQPPAMNPSKGVYGSKEMPLLAKHFGIPIKQPKNPAEAIFGTASVGPMRFLTALNMSHPQHVEEMTRQLWARIWSKISSLINWIQNLKCYIPKDLPINKPEYIAEAAKAAGIDDSLIQETMAKIQSQEIKDKLKAVTQEALDHGAFGAPTIIATDADGQKHMLFGSDRFHILADLLGETYHGPLLEFNKCSKL